MKNERLDIYDDDGNHLGIEKRYQVKRKGYWYHTFHCWVILKQHNQHYLLFQRKHLNRGSKSGRLDVSAGGHILAGETIADGVREIQEEIGLIVNFDDLTSLGTYKKIVQNQKEYKREIINLYLYECDIPLKKFVFDTKEVLGLYVMKFDDFASLVTGELEKIRIKGNEYNGKTIEKNYINVKLNDICGYDTPFLSYCVENLKNCLN